MEDFLYRFLSIYQKLPLSVKIFFGKFYTLIPLRFRYGQFYAMYFNRINLFNAVSPEKIFEMHKDLLMHTVNKAIESVDFYRKYDKCYCFEDFEYLPIVTKTIIDENKNSFINYSLKGSNLKANTGGGQELRLHFLFKSM
jgi:hypothetical protein